MNGEPVLRCVFQPQQQLMGPNCSRRSFPHHPRVVTGASFPPQSCCRKERSTQQAHGYVRPPYSAPRQARTPWPPGTHPAGQSLRLCPRERWTGGAAGAGSGARRRKFLAENLSVAHPLGISARATVMPASFHHRGPVAAQSWVCGGGRGYSGGPSRAVAARNVQLGPQAASHPGRRRHPGRRLRHGSVLQLQAGHLQGQSVDR